MRKSHLFLCGLFSAAGCLEAGDELGEAEHSLEIASNDVSTPTRNAVVWVSTGCTGTLIAPDIVLTHPCPTEHDLDGDITILDPLPVGGATTEAWLRIAPLSVAFGPSRAAPIYTVTATHVSAPAETLIGEYFYPANIRMLRLSVTVPSTIAIPRPTFVDRPTVGVASPLTLVGYGGDRDRRLGTAASYRDWTMLPAATAPRLNAFTFTPAHTGAGVGTDDANLEIGDLGAPVLLGDADGFVLGVVDGLDGRAGASFGPGDAHEGLWGSRIANVRRWISDKVPQKPDWTVTSIVATGCTGIGGRPTIAVTVKNAGVRTDTTRVDVFHGLTDAPPIGTHATIMRWVTPLAPLGTTTLTFTIPAAAGRHWIDVIVDTTRSDAELSETNNLKSERLTLPDCSFG